MKLGIFSGLKSDLDVFNKNLNENNLSLDPLLIKYINDDGYFQKIAGKSLGAKSKK